MSLVLHSKHVSGITRRTRRMQVNETQQNIESATSYFGWDSYQFMPNACTFLAMRTIAFGGVDQTFASVWFGTSLFCPVITIGVYCNYYILSIQSSGMSLDWVHNSLKITMQQYIIIYAKRQMHVSGIYLARSVVGVTWRTRCNQVKETQQNIDFVLRLR